RPGPDARPGRQRHDANHHRGDHRQPGEPTGRAEGRKPPEPLMNLRATLVQGGGIGLEQVTAVRRILEAAGVAIDWEEHWAGLAPVERGGPPLPEAMLDSVRRTGLALKTMLLSPPGPRGNINVAFRRALDLYAAVRPLRNLRGLPARFQGVNLL